MNKSGDLTLKEEFLLRDNLATDRTILAVDRTLLAYVRTALTLFVAGVSFLKFFNTVLLQALGWLFIVSGIMTIIFGLQRCIEITSLINGMSKKNGLK